jgi:hypothetical protein
VTLDDARDNIGRRVVYRPHHETEPEFGFITSVSELLVFVRYGSNPHPQGTPADRLELT